MSSFTNDDPFWWTDDREVSAQCTATARHQPAPIVGSPSGSETHLTVGPPRESYAPTGLECTTSLWPSIAFPGTPFSTSVHGGEVWSGNKWLDSACFATPVLQQTLSVTQRALPAPRSPPRLSWTQASELSSQLVSSRYHPVHPNSTQYIDHGISAGSLGMGPEVPRFQLSAPSTITGTSESTVMQTRSTVAPHDIRPLVQSDPVPVPAYTSRGERWDLPSNMINTFQCLWLSGSTRCMAVVAGDRRSVTSHLRDEHEFTCDGLTIACAWGACRAFIQRRNIPRHIVACHMEIKVPCPLCGIELSRADASKKHRLACTAGGRGASSSSAGGMMEASKTMGGCFFQRS